jgi:enoyl-CoA hydratase
VALGSQHVHYEKRHGVAWLRLDRPDRRNAYTQEMYTAIGRACIQGDADPDVQLTAITGTGDVFSVGGDLGPGYFEDPARKREDFHSLELFGDGPGAMLEVDPFKAILESKKLVVAVVNGLCQAGGFITAMLADLTITSDQATFRIPELLRGVADPWCAGRLPLYVGMERAKLIMFTGRTFTAAQALEWGLVSEVVPHAELNERAEALLDEVLLTGPEARSTYKATANRLLPTANYDPYVRSYRSDECREGLAAFRERRAPAWVPDGRRASLGRL